MYINLLTLFFFFSSFDHPFVNSQSSPFIVEVVWNETITNNSLDIEEIQNESINNCTQLLEVYAETVTNLTRCTILNARPIRICSNCGEEINATDAAFRMLQKEPCYKLYFESDEVGIVNLVYTQAKDFWTKSNCQDCSNNIEDTTRFFKVSKDLDVCIKKFNQTSKEKLNNTCSMCEELFVKMNNIYKQFVQRISSDETGGLCIDIVDQMNITRHVWKYQDCLKFDADIGYPNIVTAVVVGCIPVFFYMLSKSISNIEDVKLVRPKRKSYTSLQSESFPTE